MTVKTDLRALVRGHRDEILRLAAKRGARNVRLFGSVARGDFDEKSDVDFLIELEPGRSLFDVGGLLMDLRELLGRRVDVVPDDSIPAYSRASVLAEAVAL
jgi:predicted nucleotidyltransferase